MSHKLPIYPLHYHRVLGEEHHEARRSRRRVFEAYDGLAPAHGSARQRPAPRAWHPCADATVGLQQAVRQPRPHTGAARARREGELGRVFKISTGSRPHIRVAAGTNINYRRFSTSTSSPLADGITSCFDHLHRVLTRYGAKGCWDGCASTMFDVAARPKGVSFALRKRAPALFSCVVTEKSSLQSRGTGEDLAGRRTTVYEFANLVLGLLIDRQRRGFCHRPFCLPPA